VDVGGNTSCIEVRYDDRRVIVDAGTGIKPLGDWLVKNELPQGSIKTHLFLTHTHWDHIMGFPFFTPIFIPGSEINVYSPVNYEEESLESIMGYQLSYRHFPVRQSELSATLRYRELREETLDLEGGMRVTTKFLNHPILTLGYRFEYEGKRVVTLYDNEPFRNVFPADPNDPDYDEEAAIEGEQAAREENEKIMRFYQNADLLIHDTQYTLKEYLAAKIGWGHTPFEFAINSAHKAGVKKLLFFHHDPLRTDAQLEELLQKYCSLTESKTSMEMAVAKEKERHRV
jgi:ribonuclease BN (tRNA processing enzyme)